LRSWQFISEEQGVEDETNLKKRKKRLRFTFFLNLKIQTLFIFENLFLINLT
jgi:hypothetical protein